MAFPYKIDRDAIAGEQPVDTWFLQRVADGLEYARSRRGRQAASGFDVQDPAILACWEPHAFCWGVWDLTKRFDELTTQLRCVVSDADVDVSLVFLRRSGVSVASPTTLSASGSTQNPSLTLDLAEVRGGSALVFLVVHSADATTGVVDNTDSEVDNVKSDRIQMATGTYTALTAGKVYRLRFYDSSGTIAEAQFPASRQVLYDDSGDWHVWPHLSREEIDFLNETSSGGGGGGYDIEAIPLGQIALRGMSVYESDSQAPISIKPALRAGRLAAVRAIRALYSLGRELFEQHTRLYCCAPPWDPGRLDGGEQVLHFGVLEDYHTTAADVAADTGFTDMAHAMVGHYDKSKARDGTDQVRTTLVVRAVVMVTSTVRPGERYDWALDVRCKLASFGTTDYDATVITSDKMTTTVRGRASERPVSDKTGSLWWWRRGSQTGPGRHTLRGAFPLDDLADNFGGLYVVTLEITDTETAATQRRLTLQMQGRPEATDGRPTAAGRTWMSLVSLSVKVKEGA